MTTDTELAELLEIELADYLNDEPGWARQAAHQVVAAVRLAGWAPKSRHPMPAEEEPEGIR